MSRSLILLVVPSKLHGLWGHSMALFVMQTLIATVNEMISLESESLEVLLTRLEKEEDSHYDQAFRRNLVDAELRNLFDGGSGYKFDELANVVPNFDWYSLFLTGKSICHTARLPSQIRYRGVLTESEKVGGPSVWGDETYDTGLELDQAKTLPNAEATKTLPIVYGANDGQRRHKCPFVIAPDAKDSFYTQYGYGWPEFVIPNAATKEAYHYDPKSMQGIVIMVFHTCDWGMCPEGMLTAVDLNDGKKWDIKINGVPVTNLTGIGNDAIVVQHANGINFPQNSDGGYRLEFHVNKPGYYALISSIIVF
jgi:hypothetical protein